MYYLISIILALISATIWVAMSVGLKFADGLWLSTLFMIGIHSVATYIPSCLVSLIICTIFRYR